jgi:hypothetical protein
MYPEPIDTFPKRIGRYDMYFVQQQESPFPRSDPLHYFFGIVSSFTSDTDHRVGGNDNSGGASELESALVV